MFKILKMNKKLNKKTKGSVLLEALIGILLFSFGIIGLALFQAITVINNAENAFRAEASVYMNEVIGKMWATNKPLSTFAVENEEIPGTEIRLPAARKTIVVDGNKVEIELTWKRPSDNTRAKAKVQTIITPNG